MSAEPLLVLHEVCAGYAETVVLENISLELAAAETLSIIGRNGVGKTSLLATIMGHTALHSGAVEFRQHSIAHEKTYHRVARGIGLVPQEREIFASLTVAENLKIAIRNGQWRIDDVYALFPQLYARRQNLGTQLSGGEQQMLAIGRALVGNPSLLLMDEPSEGLAPVIVEQLLEAMIKLREAHALAIILVEQNSRIALDFARRTIVMDRGQIQFDGASAQLGADPGLLERLIGVRQQ